MTEASVFAGGGNFGQNVLIKHLFSGAFQMAVIGIVGGVGPYAGLDLAQKIFDQTKAASDQAHLPLALLSLPHRITDRTAFLLGETDENPGVAIAEVIGELYACGATVVGIPCNTAHAAPIFAEIVTNLPPAVTLVHMIDEVGRYIREKHPDCENIGLLSTTGTRLARIYPDTLARYGLNVIQVEEEMQDALIQPAVYHPTYGIKARSHPVTPRARENLEAGMDALAQKGAQAILMGCTEIPLAFSEKRYKGVPLLDSTRILARALIRAFAPYKLAE
jgi:aspartate racemase